jgi:hypothetical protein
VARVILDDALPNLAMGAPRMTDAPHAPDCPTARACTRWKDSFARSRLGADVFYIKGTRSTHHFESPTAR